MCVYLPNQCFGQWRSNCCANRCMSESALNTYYFVCPISNWDDSVSSYFFFFEDGPRYTLLFIKYRIAVSSAVLKKISFNLFRKLKTAVVLHESFKYLSVVMAVMITTAFNQKLIKMSWRDEKSNSLICDPDKNEMKNE